jgi:hypothetical protein
MSKLCVILITPDPRSVHPVLVIFGVSFLPLGMPSLAPIGSRFAPDLHLICT